MCFSRTKVYGWNGLVGKSGTNPCGYPAVAIPRQLKAERQDVELVPIKAFYLRRTIVLDVRKLLGLAGLA